MARHLLIIHSERDEERLLFTMLRRAGLLNHREVRELEQSTIALRTTTAFYAGLALTGTILVVLLVGFGSGMYYGSQFGLELPPPLGPAEKPTSPVPDNTPDVHAAYQARMDRLLRELEAVSDQQRALEVMLADKSTEAAEMASQTELLHAQLRIKEREVQALSAMPEPEPERRFERGSTEYRQSAGQAQGDLHSNEKRQIAPATAVLDAPAEIFIDINPPDARPGNPYKLRLEIQNRGNTAIHVTDLEVVWNYAGRNTGGPLSIGRRLVGPRSTSVIYEVDGVWIEELAAGAIVATVTLEGGDQLVNTLRWKDG